MSINYSETQLKDVQIFISKTLQDSAAQANDNGNIDFLTFINYWIEIGKIYKKNAMSQFKQLAKNRKKFEEEMEKTEETYVKEINPS